MHAYLLTGTDEKRIDKTASDLAKKEKATLMEFEVVKISDIRELSKFTNLKAGGKTGIYIKGIDNATTEALNAFLKNLEEPQEDLFYILTASSEHKLLPTITSRCQIIRLGKRSVSEKSIKETKEFLKLSETDKLIFIKGIRKRDEALLFLENLIYSGHTMLQNQDGDRLKLATLLKQAEVAKTRINAYGNPSLQLTSFVLKVV